MSQRHRAGSTGSLGPDDEVMPYSDDETDDELDASSEGEAAEAPEPEPGAPQPPVDARSSGESPVVSDGGQYQFLKG